MADNKRKFKSTEEALEFKSVYVQKFEETLANFEEKSKEWLSNLEKYFDAFTAHRIIKKEKEMILSNKGLFEGLFKDKLIEQYSIENFEKAYKGWDGSKEISKIEKLVGILQAADELPLEIVQGFYSELDANVENRLYSFKVLEHSNHADIFVPLLLKDIEDVYGKDHKDYPRVKAEMEEKAKRAAEAKANAKAPQNGDDNN